MLADLEDKARSLFAEAAARQQAFDEWEASGRDTGMPMGVVVMATYVAEAVSSWRAEAETQGVLTEAPENPDPAEDEPAGLSLELFLLYRQFAAQVAAVEGE